MSEAAPSVNQAPDIVDGRAFLDAASSRLLIDVRSPGEFADGHMPGAVNVPLFDDDQRAEIGTLYQQQGREPAIRRGLEIVGPKMASLEQQVATANEQGQFSGASVCVHCWRGGMRSESVAWLLNLTGWQVTLLRGGYKAYRSFAREQFSQPLPLIVMSGLTGAGKTERLLQLADAGEQVIDLEGMACHRGSAYGGLGEPDQPTTQQFENDLATAVGKCDLTQRIWVEDEGNRIGRVVVPEEFHQQLRNAPAVFLDVPKLARVRRLVRLYGDLDADELAHATEKIGKRLGGQHVKAAIEAIRSGDIGTAVDITLSYYDRTYQKAADKMPRETMVPLPLNDLSDVQCVAEIIDCADGLMSDTCV